METKIKVKKKVNVSKADFEAYERVRISGVTNMFAVGVVMSYSGLSRETIIAIMENYDDLNEEYPDVRN